MNALALTLLYVPADRPDRVAKALAGPADVVLVDLEDAVAPAAKVAARAALSTVLDSPAGRERAAAGALQLRINGIGTPWHDDDLALFSGLPPGVGARVPKVEDPAVVRQVADRLPGRPLHLLVESALGVERAFASATAHVQVASLGLGEADLRSDLRVTDEAGLLWARARVVNAARAAGLPSPAMSVHPHLRDLEALARSCAVGRALGFLGRAAIHPAQLDVIRTAFLPTPEEVARAEQVLARVADALAVGVGAFALSDGTFLDAAMVDQARAVLEVAERS